MPRCCWDEARTPPLVVAAMKHLIISRELPPATYAAGGIGTYVANIARLLAERGETVHLIGERWSGAPLEREVLHDGRLIIHRIGVDDVPQPIGPHDPARLARELDGLKKTAFPAQWFGWSAAFLAERLIEEEGIDAIEAQEWEAPLYTFLLRRSLGLGPDRAPPCIVHLHSPTTFIHHYNGPVTIPAAHDTMKRMEEFCILSADALVCPSRSLAADAADHYRIARERIESIPLPVGFTPRIERSEAVWRDGSICFVGRLEPRKGVIEWVEAAIRVARRNPAVHFDFVGADIWHLRDALVKQIGEELAPRFRFHGAKNKEEIGAYLGRACAGVVPSRWENFPNVCIEAMSSGLPVIATRFGGMVEMVEDGRTGWLAEDAGVAGLADSLAAALERCLATPAAEKAAMGAAAADAIRGFCDNRAIADAHARFRSGVVERGAHRSMIAGRGDPVAPPNVVVRTRSIGEAAAVLGSLAAQTLRAQAIVVVHQEPGQGESDAALRFHHAPTLVGPRAWNAGAALLAGSVAPGFWLFLDHADALAPDAIERMAAAFTARADVGIVSPWTDRLGREDGLDARPSPSLVHQMVGNDVAPASGFRAAAIGDAPPFRAGLPREHDVWALANDVIAKGWTAVTLPALLASRRLLPVTTSWVQDTALRALRAEALSAFQGDANRLALQIVETYVPLGQRPPEGSSGGDKRYRRAALRALSAIILRPRDTAWRSVRYARRLTRTGAGR